MVLKHPDMAPRWTEMGVCRPGGPPADADSARCRNGNRGKVIKATGIRGDRNDQIPTECLRAPVTNRGDAMATKRFNAVTLDMLWTRLISIVDEVAAALVRTSFSTVVRESNDFAPALTDARGRRSRRRPTPPVVHRYGSAHHPALPPAFLRESQAPADILITNHIWLGTGHLPVITVASPIFHGRLVGFPSSSRIAGHRRQHPFPRSRDVFEEGLQIPIMRRCARAGSMRRWSGSCARTCAFPTRSWATCTLSS